MLFSRRVLALLAILLSFVPRVAAAQTNEVTPAAERRGRVGDGRILTDSRLLLPDRWPSQQRKNIPAMMPGAPNFRQIPGEPIYGTAQPDIEGFKNILTHLGAGPGGKVTVRITNLRQEPIAFINGTPYTVHDKSLPFENLENPHATAAQVEATDTRLKHEILEQMRANDGKITVYVEPVDMKIEPKLENVQSVQTLREVYDGLRAQGYHIDFARVPISDEKSPDDANIDALVDRLKNDNGTGPLIFNCQAGHGRTTTAMIIADEILHSTPYCVLKVPSKDTAPVGKRDKYLAGNYQAIVKLVEMLSYGPQAKLEADAAIDRAAAILNLREAIVKQRDKWLDQKLSTEKRAEALARGQDWLRRYFYVIALQAYLDEQTPQNFKITFSEWMKLHHLHELLRNPLLSRMWEFAA